MEGSSTRPCSGHLLLGAGAAVPPSPRTRGAHRPELEQQHGLGMASHGGPSAPGAPFPLPAGDPLSLFACAKAPITPPRQKIHPAPLSDPSSAARSRSQRAWKRVLEAGKEEGGADSGVKKPCASRGVEILAHRGEHITRFCTNRRGEAQARRPEQILQQNESKAVTLGFFKIFCSTLLIPLSLPQQCLGPCLG